MPAGVLNTMIPERFTFSKAQINRQFPFYIRLNSDLSISAAGSSIIKLLGDCTGCQFTDYFSIKRPVYEEIDFDVLKADANKLILIEINNKQKNILKGELEFLEDSGQLLFIGSLWLNALEELTTLKLTNNDFAIHDSIIDLLHLLRIQELVNDDLKELLNKVNLQKKALDTAAIQYKEIAASLEESNQRFGYASRATADAIWDWDILKGTIYRGEGFAKLFGYKGQEVTGRLGFWKERVHPEDFETTVEGIAEILDSDAVNWTTEYRFLKIDGTYAHVLDKGFVVRDENNHPVRMVGAMQDITAKKEEEMRLKLLESVIVNINDAVIITRAFTAPEGQPIIAYVNPAFTNMTGYSSNEVMGSPLTFLLGPESDSNKLEKLKDAFANAMPHETEMITYRKNGGRCWTSIAINPVYDKDGLLSHWIIIHRDISAAKKAAEEIEKQKKFWEDILNNLPSDLCVCDHNHNYLFMNYHGIKDAETREWLIGKNDFDFFKRRGLDDKIAVVRRAHFNEALETKKLVEWMEETLLADGSTRYMVRKYYPYFEDGELKFIIGYSIDISERKAAEIKINEALAAMKKSNDDLEQFAYVTSHDLQEPLRMVSSFLSLLEKIYAPQLDEKAKSFIHFAVDGAKRMQQLIQDLLEYSRVGRIETRQETVDLNELTKEILVLYSGVIQEKEACINFENLPSLTISKAPMRQVFQNLISNGLKYSSEKEKPLISITAKDNKSHWEFAFSDNGIGIEQHHYDRIFVIFQRLHTRQTYSGTGIGLAITKKIIESFGGKIWLESTPGKGTTFYFTIPKNTSKLNDAQQLNPAAT